MKVPILLPEEPPQSPPHTCLRQTIPHWHTKVGAVCPGPRGISYQLHCLDVWEHGDKKK